VTAPHSAALRSSVEARLRAKADAGYDSETQIAGEEDVFAGDRLSQGSYCG